MAPRAVKAPRLFGGPGGGGGAIARARAIELMHAAVQTRAQGSILFMNVMQ